MSVKDKDMGWNRINKELNQLKKAEITVGIHFSAGRNEKAVADGEPVAAYAAKNEFGAGNIPARPFMSTAFDMNIERWERKIQSNVFAVLEDQKSLKNAVGEIAYLATGDTVAMVDSIYTPANAEATIAKKKSSKPLVDTGLMRSSILPMVTWK